MPAIGAAHTCAACSPAAPTAVTTGVATHAADGTAARLMLSMGVLLVGCRYALHSALAFSALSIHIYTSEASYGVEGSGAVPTAGMAWNGVCWCDGSVVHGLAVAAVAAAAACGGDGGQ